MIKEIRTCICPKCGNETIIKLGKPCIECRCPVCETYLINK